MSYEVFAIATFSRNLKVLAKKYPSLRKEYAELVAALELDPFQGTPLGSSCYKLRLAIASKRKGKSGGARVILHVVIRSKHVWLLSIYDKSEQSSVPLAEIRSLLTEIPLER